MKKFSLIFILCFSFLTRVKATNIDVSVSCPSTGYKGTTITCNITGNAVGGSLTGIKGNFDITNGVFNSFTPSSSWTVYASSSSGFVIGNTSGITGNSLLGSVSITLTGDIGSNMTFVLSNLNATNTEYEDYDITNRRSGTSIIKKEEYKPPEEKPNNNNNNNNKNNNSNNNNNNKNNNNQNNTPSKKEAYLDSLEVEGFDINFSKDKYEYIIEVNDAIKKINIKASSSYEIEGTGTFDINKDNNTFKVIVTSPDEKKEYTINVKVISNNTSNDIDSINKVLSIYDSVSIKLDKNSDKNIAYKNILISILGKNKKIIYNIYDHDKILYSYIFDGSKMDIILSDINLDITFDKNNETDIKGIIFTTNYKSYFPSGTILKIYNIKESSKDIKKLYRINSENYTELISDKLSFDNDNVSFTIEKGDKYLLSNIITNDYNPYITISIIQTLLIIAIVIESINITYKYLKVKKEKKNS